MPQLDATYYTSSVAWFLLCFGALFFFLQFWLIPRLNGLNEKRRKEINAKLEEISLLRSELVALDSRYNSEIDSIKLEAKELSDRMMEDFSKETTKMLSKINKHCETMLKNEEKKIHDNFSAILSDKEKIAYYLADAFLSKATTNNTKAAEKC